MQINLKCTKQRLKRTDTEYIVDYSQNYLTLNVEFTTTDWNNLSKKVLFRHNNETYQTLLTPSQYTNIYTCTVPPECLKDSNYFTITIVGFHQDIRITTNYVGITLEESLYTTQLTTSTGSSEQIIDTLVNTKFDHVIIENNNLLFYANDHLVQTVPISSVQSVSWDNVTGKPSSFPPSEHTHSVASASVDGFMSKGDKVKLDGIDSSKIESVDNKVGVINNPSSASVCYPTDYAVQQLVDGSLEVYHCDYGITSYSEVLGAINDGKFPILRKDGIIYTVGPIQDKGLTTDTIIFTSIFQNSSYQASINKSNVWSSAKTTLENANFKVTSISASSTNKDYPTGKCVYDNLQLKQGKLTAGTNITISDDNVISATGGGSGVQSDWTETDTTKESFIQHKPDLNLKQDKLVGTETTGQNIKTINGNNILGTGNLEVGGSYTLPIAKADTLGGVKVGDNLTIDSTTGKLDATDTTYNVATASNDGLMAKEDKEKVNALPTTSEISKLESNNNKKSTIDSGSTSKATDYPTVEAVLNYHDSTKAEATHTHSEYALVDHTQSYTTVLVDATFDTELYSSSSASEVAPNEKITLSGELKGTDDILNIPTPLATKTVKILQDGGDLATVRTDNEGKFKKEDISINRDTVFKCTFDGATPYPSKTSDNITVLCDISGIMIVFNNGLYINCDSAFGVTEGLTYSIDGGAYLPITGGILDLTSYISSTTVHIKGNITEINSGYFENKTNFTKLHLSHSITTLGANTFKGCTDIGNLLLPAHLERMEWSCFENCSTIPEVTLHSEVVFIGNDCFKGCSDLTKVTFESLSVPHFDNAFVFANIGANPTAYVPMDSVSDYESELTLENCGADFIVIGV